MLTDIETTRSSTGSLLGTRLELAGRPVLLATDGSPASLAAASVARDLAAHHRAKLHVVSVVDTRSAPMPPPLDIVVGIADAAIGDAIHAEQVAAVRATLETSLGEAVPWDVRMALGTPAQAIVREAGRLGAALILVGLRRHGRMDRVIQDETTLEVMRHAACPVLGVVDGARGLPTRALVAMDFSLASLAAAHATRAVLADDGTIVLAYVPVATFDLPDDGEAVIHRLGVEAGFAQCRAELDEGRVTTDSVVLHRELTTPVAASILEYADSARCDLLAAGSARRGRFDRWMLGSVSTDLVRDGRRSVLVTPPHARQRARP